MKIRIQEKGRDGQSCQTKPAYGEKALRRPELEVEDKVRVAGTQSARRR